MFLRLLCDVCVMCSKVIIAVLCFGNVVFVHAHRWLERNLKKKGNFLHLEMKLMV